MKGTLSSSEVSYVRSSNTKSNKHHKSTNEVVKSINLPWQTYRYNSSSMILNGYLPATNYQQLEELIKGVVKFGAFEEVECYKLDSQLSLL